MFGAEGVEQLDKLVSLSKANRAPDNYRVLAMFMIQLLLLLTACTGTWSWMLQISGLAR